MRALTRAAVLIALLTGMPAGAAATGEIEAALLKLEQQRADAILRRDIPALRRLMDRYYRHVESRGRVRSKTGLLTALERDEFRFQTYENESAEVQVLDGGKSAIVAGVFRSRQEGGKPFRGRFVRVWVREAEGWKNTFHQGTEIRPATEGCQCK
ncbi:nuclear transport factor 2 family protein [Massilia suwonensis]|uniref:Nuclear transport factor 2 family protein n=1 Tax=Massilia suwonensis TaxID=648895 RepID=A0ABW0MM98_9BURK